MFSFSKTITFNCIKEKMVLTGQIWTISLLICILFFPTTILFIEIFHFTFPNALVIQFLIYIKWGLLKKITCFSSPQFIFELIDFLIFFTNFIIIFFFNIIFTHYTWCVGEYAGCGCSHRTLLRTKKSKSNIAVNQLIM